MNKNNDVTSQLNRMKQLMKFGLNEGKKQSYNGLEYEREGADGKMYGIVREGTKYYIKVSPSNKGKLVENYEYIGGFRNRKDNQYSSFAEAQKQFDLKMMSLKEANTPNKKIVVESWNPDRQEELTVESTNKLKREIARERQIMYNASRINENKTQECGNACPEGYDFKDGMKPKNNIKGAKPEPTGDAKTANKGYKKATLPEGKACPKCGKDPCVCDKNVDEAAEPLAWHSDGGDSKQTIADTYMDKSHGTQIGDSAPFDDAKARDIDDNKGPVTKTSAMKNGVVEGVAMHDEGENQNSPKPGVGEIGDDDPFTKKTDKVNEDIDDVDADADVEDGEPLDAPETNSDDLGDDTEGFDDGDYDDSLTDDDSDMDSDPEIEDLRNQISDLDGKLDAIMSAVGADEPEVDADDYEDDSLYDDNADLDSDEDEYGVEDDADDFGDEDDDEEVYESRAYRRQRIAESRSRRPRRMRRINEDGMKPFSDAGRVPSGNMNRLNDFGKHPAYQKKVMTLPNPDMEEKPDYYDMNDKSVRSTEPYGKKIGSSAPFLVDPQAVENSIAESIKRNLKKLVR